MRDFLAELKSVCASIDSAKSVQPVEQLYNVHKRSLPVELDKPVAFNLREDEAKRLVRLKKPYMIENTVIYFDRVVTNGSREEMSVYYNPKEIIRESVDTDNIQSQQPWID